MCRDQRANFPLAFSLFLGRDRTKPISAFLKNISHRFYQCWSPKIYVFNLFLQNVVVLGCRILRKITLSIYYKKFHEAICEYNIIDTPKIVLY